jgi:hypothetical protein
MKIYYPVYCSNSKCRRYADVIELWLSLRKDTDVEVKIALLGFLFSHPCECGQPLKPCCPMPEEDF